MMVHPPEHPPGCLGYVLHPPQQEWGQWSAVCWPSAPKTTGAVRTREPVSLARLMSLTRREPVSLHAQQRLMQLDMPPG